MEKSLLHVSTHCHFFHSFHLFILGGGGGASGIGAKAPCQLYGVRRTVLYLRHGQPQCGVHGQNKGEMRGSGVVGTVVVGELFEVGETQMK